jgi:hypothetical protein
MKRIVPVVFILAAVLFSAACTTMNMFSYEDENIYAELETNDPKQITLTINNRSGVEITLDQSSAGYTHGNQESPLTPVTATQSGDQVPALHLSPRSQQSRSFALERAVTRNSGKPSISDWLPADNAGDCFAFIYRIGGEDHPLIFPDTHERVILGKVSVTLDIAMPFTSSIIDRRRKIYDKALEQAKASFGLDGRQLRLVNLRYSSKSNAFVENAALSADVVAAD